MTDDLVKRLGNELEKAATLAHAQHTRIEQLEAALRGIIGALDDPNGGQHVSDMRFASSIARAALGEKKNDVL